MADQKTSIVITAEDKTQGALASVRSGMAGLTQSFGALNAIAARIPAIGSILAGVSFGAAIKGGIDFAASLNDMAAQTGATVEQLSALRNVAELGGVSLDEAGKALQKLSKNMADASRGTKEQLDTFSALGVAFKTSGGQLRESGNVMVDVAKAIAGLESPTERAAAAQLVFGKTGAQLVPMLMDLARQGELSATVTTEQAEAADRFDDALTRMRQGLRGMGERIGLELVEPLADLAEKLEELTKSGAGSNEIELPWLDKFVNKLATGLATAEKSWAESMASFWRSVGFGSRADAFARDAETAAQNLVNLAIERQRLSLGDWNDQVVLPPAGKGKGKSFAERLAEASSTGGKAAKVKENPYAGLAGFDEGRSAKEIMAALHAEDKALESLRQKYVNLIDPIQQYREQLDEIDRLEQGGTLSSAEALEARWQVQEKITAATEDTTDALKEQKSIAQELGLTFSSAFEDAIVGGKKFSEVLQGLGEDILRLITRKNLTEPLAEGIGSINWGSLFSLNALGGVYSGAGISAYSGSVVSRPTVFPFASGIGLMGEAGPEAILPLTRGADGKLGVSGGGSNVVVNVIEAPGRGGQQQRRNENGVNVLDVFVEKIKASIAGDISDGRGAIPAAMSNSYGLNRAAGAY